MSNLCLECLNLIKGTHYKKQDVVESGWDEEDLGVCVSCGERKELVIFIKRRDFFTWLYKI